MNDELFFTAMMGDLARVVIDHTGQSQDYQQFVRQNIELLKTRMKLGDDN